MENVRQLRPPAAVSCAGYPYPDHLFAARREGERGREREIVSLQEEISGKAKSACVACYIRRALLRAHTTYAHTHTHRHTHTHTHTHKQRERERERERGEREMRRLYL